MGHLEKTLKALWVISLGPILSAMLTFYTPIEHTSYMHRVPLGAVHILRQPKSGVSGPPLPPPSAMVSIWLTPPPPFVSFRQHLPDAPFELQFYNVDFFHDKKGEIHLLEYNLHVTWL